MERNFYNEEFEDLIKQKAGQYKMYPSDKVWKNIHSSLHTRRRWFIAGMFSLITGILFFAGKELLIPSVHVSAVKKTIDNTESNVAESPKKLTEEVVSIAPVFSEFKASVSPQKLIPDNNIVTGDSTLLNVINYNNTLAAEPNNVASVFADNEDNDIIIRPHRGFNSTKIDVIEDESNSSNVQGITPATLNPTLQNVASNSSASASEDKKQTSLLQSTAPYELISPKKLNRKNWQIYISPTVNYRKLSGADIYANAKPNVQNGPIAATAQNGNPNQYTNNKPAIGFEIGSSLIYKFTRNLSFKAGLQFNYSRYTINAYASNTQPATIALNSVNGYPNNTITAYTNIGTIGGKATVNLQNQYLQLSAPVGFELRVMGNEKLQINIGATIQPTYLLNRDSYLLTSDYTNYTQEPSLFRRWNVNGAVEAFISYKTGNIRWQVGPQFRYQLLSTYTSQYPLNENLKGFGIKFGISKTIW